MRTSDATKNKHILSDIETHAVDFGDINDDETSKELSSVFAGVSFISLLWECGVGWILGALGVRVHGEKHSIEFSSKLKIRIDLHSQNPKIYHRNPNGRASYTTRIISVRCEFEKPLQKLQGREQCNKRKWKPKLYVTGNPLKFELECAPPHSPTRTTEIFRFVWLFTFWVPEYRVWPPYTCISYVIDLRQCAATQIHAMLAQ